MKYDNLINELRQMKTDLDEMINQVSSLFPHQEKINDCHSVLKIRMQRISHDKNKMLNQGENEENAHAFCSSCVVKLKEKYNDGKEAMHEVTDEVIAEIEDGCSMKK